MTLSGTHCIRNIPVILPLFTVPGKHGTSSSCTYSVVACLANSYRDTISSLPYRVIYWADIAAISLAIHVYFTNLDTS